VSLPSQGDRRADDPREDRGTPWAQLARRTPGELVKLAGDLQSRLRAYPAQAEMFRDGLVSIKGILDSERAAERVAADGAGWGARKTFLLGLLRDGVDPGLISERAGVPGKLMGRLAWQVDEEPAPPATPGAAWHRASRATAATRLLAGDSPASRTRISRDTGLPDRTVGGIADALRALGDFDDWPAVDHPPLVEEQRSAAFWLLGRSDLSPDEIAELLGEDLDTIGAWDQERRDPGQPPVKWKRGETPKVIRELAGRLLDIGMTRPQVRGKLHLSHTTINSVSLERRRVNARVTSPWNQPRTSPDPRQVRA